MIELRDLETGDLTVIHEMNQQAQPHVSGVPPGAMARFAASVPYFRVAHEAGRLAGFLIGMTPETPYDSMNFRWFLERYPSFVYIDRIVVADHARRRGIARMLYDDIARFAVPLAPILACEVNVRPRNDASLRFHERFGFQAVGSQDTEGGKKTVSYMTWSVPRPPDEARSP